MTTHLTRTLHCPIWNSHFSIIRASSSPEKFYRIKNAPSNPHIPEKKICIRDCQCILYFGWLNHFIKRLCYSYQAWTQHSHPPYPEYHLEQFKYLQYPYTVRIKTSIRNIPRHRKWDGGVARYKSKWIWIFHNTAFEPRHIPETVYLLNKRKSLTHDWFYYS